MICNRFAVFIGDIRRVPLVIGYRLLAILPRCWLQLSDPLSADDPSRMFIWKFRAPLEKLFAQGPGPIGLLKPAALLQFGNNQLTEIPK
jgi:hypothetical protein